MQKISSADKWPSSSIGFYTRGVKYSRPTHDLIKLLMAEQKMNMFQQSKINSYLRSGQSLPKMILNQNPSRKICIAVAHSMFVMTKNRRTLAAIKASGDLDREQYIPKRFESWEQKKKRFQEQMSGFNNLSAIEEKKCIESTFCGDGDKYQLDPTSELLHEIQVRLEWIDEMNKLGEGYEYKPFIRNEIAERLRLIKNYDSKVNSNK